MSVTKKIFKTLFPVPVTNMVSDAFFGWGWGVGVGAIGCESKWEIISFLVLKLLL